MRSPFKFLDPYTREDSAIFFGRDEEIDRLYDYVNKNRLILVYGTSGTGKTSLVQCGLAGRFDATDWYPFFIRRGDNINDSLRQTLARVVGDKYGQDVSGAIERINARSLRPVYLILDQFEELLIMGSADEQAEFIKTIKSLLDTQHELDCHILFILREEFIARLYHFEQEIPTLFDRRLRVEPMGYGKVSEVITGSCQRFNIRLQEPAHNVDQIIGNLSTGRSGLSLPYLQVYLDMLWREDYEREYGKAGVGENGSRGERVQKRADAGVQKEGESSVAVAEPAPNGFPALEFTTEEIDKFGAIEDVLARFLAQQTQSIQTAISKHYPKAEEDTVRQMLDAFVTEEGTKRPVPYTRLEEVILFDRQAPEYLWCLSEESADMAHEVVMKLEQSRILRLTEDQIELAHDALAHLIDQQRSDEQRRLNEVYNRLQNNFREYRESGEWLSRRQLTLLEDFMPRLDPRLDDEVRAFIRGSYAEAIRREDAEREIERRQQQEQQERLRLTEEKLKVERRGRRRLRYLLAGLGLLLLVCLMFAWTVGQQAEASSNNALALRMISTDPTLALRMAEYNYNNNPDEEAPAVTLNTIVSNPNLNFYQTSFSGHEGTVYSVAFSPSGEYVLTGSLDGTAKLWSTDGQEIGTLYGHEGGVFSVAFSPDSRQVLTGSEDGTARLWTLEGELKTILRGHEAVIRAVAFSPDGKYVLTGGEDGTARLWTPDGKPMVAFEHDDKVRAVAFSADGQRVLTGSEDWTARVWNLEGEELIQLNGHKGAVSSVSFSQEGLMLTGSDDGTARIWDQEGTELHALTNHEGWVLSAAFSPDGESVLTGSYGTANLWNPDTDEVKMYLGHAGRPVWSVAFSPDGQYILTGGEDSNARLWDLHQRQTWRVNIHEAAIWSVAFSPDGRSLLTGSLDGTAGILPFDTGQVVLLPGQERGVWSVAFSPDGDLVLTGSPDSTAILWRRDGARLATLRGHQGEVTGVAFAPAGGQLLTASADQTVKIWTPDGKLVRTLQGHEGWISALTFSPDGQYLLTGSYDGTARFWTLEGEEMGSIGDTTAIEAVTFSPDGQYVATAGHDEVVKVWNLEGEQVATLSGHNGTVLAVQYSPDGRYLLTGSQDGTAKLWMVNGNKGIALQNFSGFSGAVNAVRFYPDGKHVITAHSDGSLQHWQTFDVLLTDDAAARISPEVLRAAGLSNW